MEKTYNAYAATVSEMAGFFKKHSIPMMLLKGWGLSLDWPIPSHRQTGDIDIYLMGRGGEADRLMKNEYGIEPKQNEDKHSTFSFQGYAVENHACFINDTIQPSLRALEKFFEEDAENAILTKVNDMEVLLPSAASNALFLPHHCGNHFFRNEASIRQLCDWATFVCAHGKDVDWAATERMAKRAGFFPFFCCLNGIVQDYLGVSAECIPTWKRSPKMECRVLDEILKIKSTGKRSLLDKIRRFFASAWKYRLMYRSSMFVTFFRLASSYLRSCNEKSKNIWE